MVAWSMGASWALAQDAAADKKAIKRILEEIELVPSLYAKDEAPERFKTLPKFSARALAGYALDKSEGADRQRALWQQDAAKYAGEFPLRAAVFAAAEQAARVRKVHFSLTLPGPLTPQSKVEWFASQTHPGEAIFKLEEVLQAMKEAAQQRERETSKRWQANFDFALGRLQTDLVYLYEYNYALTYIRADRLPDLGPTDEGWQISFVVRAGVPEPKVKHYAKECRNLWKKIEIEHPGTPWAHGAEHENRRPLGMHWVVARK